MKQKFRAYYIDLVRGKRKGALEALFSFILLLASFVYGFFLRLILACYQIRLLKSYKAGCRVISVGNITWGGTGKTPLVETLVKFFKQAGKKPAVLIRGYGKDEVDMLKSKFKDIPILAGRDRISTARVAQLRYGADTIILDDGFQHWRLMRDLDIVLIDATCPFGNRRLIPRGILREPLSSLSRADAFVLTRTQEATQNIEPIKKELRRYNRRAAIYEAIHAPTSLRNLRTQEATGVSAIKDEQIAALSGIGTPKSFSNTLRQLGAKVSLEFHFPDHYQYSKEDLEKVEKRCLEQQIKTVVTTEKDAARLTSLLRSHGRSLKILALGIEVKIVKQEERFFSLLKSGKDSQGPYSILILSDGKAGHLNQSKAVAQIIRKRKIEQGKRPEEVDREIVEVKFRNRLCRLLLNLCPAFSNSSCRSCFWCLRFCLKKGSFEELMQAHANIIVSAGSTLSAVNVFLSYKNGARKVILMKPPFLSLDRFDLAIIPEHDRARPRDNVLLTRIAPNLIDQQYLQEQTKSLIANCKLQIANYENKGPTIGVLIGGDTARYRLNTETMDEIIRQLKEAAQDLDGRVLVTTSRRTPEAVEELLKDNLRNFQRCRLLVIANEKNIPEAVGGILGLSDIIVVSGESISMVSEALSAEKYVLVFSPQKKAQITTKQDEFLEKLRKEGIIKVIQAGNLSSKIEKIWKEKPIKTKIQDKELIYRAISKIV